MKMNEPYCVVMKRRGAEHVAQMLSRKSRKEQLDFWIKRSERLVAKQKRNQVEKAK